MYRLWRFLRRYYVLFLFIVLEALAINYYVKSTSYTRARIYSLSNASAGWVHGITSDIKGYFALRQENERLMDDLCEARTTLNAYRLADTLQDTPPIGGRYFFSAARIISNSITRQNNYFVIDRGAEDGVRENMAVLSPSGAVAGYVQQYSDNYAVCMSILNTDFRIGGKLKGKEYFGSLFWDGVSPRYVTLSDIPRYAPMEKGDTILSAYSLRFPPDSFIGTVEDYAEAGDGTYLEIKVRLGIDMMKLSNVILVYFPDAEELSGLAGEHYIGL